MTKKLTRRQKQFLSQFLDMYQEMDEPIHYVALAKRLDIGNVTAYEMLRLLEKRGLVEMDYHLSSGDRGPGRSTVLFQPTQAAINLFKILSGDAEDTEDWELVKQRILQQLNEGKAGGYEALLNDLLVRIPERRSSLIFITEMITATLLTVVSTQKTIENKGLVDRLRRIGRPGEIGLSALAGISATLSLVENVQLDLATSLLEQSGKYQEKLIEIGEEKRNQLSGFAREVARIVKG